MLMLQRNETKNPEEAICEGNLSLQNKLACMLITCQFRLIFSEFPFKLINICIPCNSQQTMKHSLQTASILFVRLDDLMLC
jgi:hypothetical protein